MSVKTEAYPFDTLFIELPHASMAVDPIVGPWVQNDDGKAARAVLCGATGVANVYSSYTLAAFMWESGKHVPFCVLSSGNKRSYYNGKSIFDAEMESIRILNDGGFRCAPATTRVVDPWRKEHLSSGLEQWVLTSGRDELGSVLIDRVTSKITVRAQPFCKRLTWLRSYMNEQEPELCRSFYVLNLDRYAFASMEMVDKLMVAFGWRCRPADRALAAVEAWSHNATQLKAALRKEE